MIEILFEVRQHLAAALELLDRVEDPAAIGPHIDLAKCRLEETLEKAGIRLPPIGSAVRQAGT